MMRSILLAAASIAAIAAAPASAQSVTYTFAGVFDGSINGNPFSNVAATFTGIGDASNAFFAQDANFVPLTSLSANVPATGQTFDFGSGFNFWSSQAFGTSGFKTGNDFIAFTGLGGYSNPSNLANTAVSVYYYATSPFASSGGDVIISNAVDTSFSASVAAVPEPATWALMLLGFGAIGYSMRRRTKTTVSYA